MKSFENWNIYILGPFEEVRTNSDIWRIIFNQVLPTQVGFLPPFSSYRICTDAIVPPFYHL